MNSDRRLWLDSDRPGERLAVGSPLPGVYLLSARGSDRRCREYHSDFRVCLLRLGQWGVGASYRCRGSHGVGSGELMAFEPGDHHVTLDVTGRVSFDVVGISVEQMQAAARELGVRGEFHFKSARIDQPGVALAVQEFVSAAAQCADRLELEAKHTALLERLVETCGETPAPLRRSDSVRHFGVRKARDYLRDNYLANPSLDELARASGLSRFSFAHAFKRYVGMPPHAYLKLRRACEARDLIERGVPIVDVMARLGYTDVPFLTRTLKRYFGATPARWRSAFRANSTPGVAASEHHPRVEPGYNPASARPSKSSTSRH
jgi:AraC-like DNA-binding protein